MQFKTMKHNTILLNGKSKILIDHLLVSLSNGVTTNFLININRENGIEFKDWLTIERMRV
ncbi:hypothetical protein LguiA_025895 [Lonicera macranthoides]